MHFRSFRAHFAPTNFSDDDLSPQVFCVDEETHPEAREHLLTLIAEGNEVESSIPFCLVAEGKGAGDGGGDGTPGGAGGGAAESKFQDMAYCEVSLLDVFKDAQDLQEAEVPMLMPDGTVAATLFLSLFATEAIESLMA